MNETGQRFEPSPTILSESSAVHDAALDGLRGLCAFSVLYCHLTVAAPRLDPGWSPSYLLWWVEVGQGSVLLFFVLSGYVIGLTNRHSFSLDACRQYLARRAVRIVPINVIGIGLAVVATWAVLPSAKSIVGNLLFLQNAMPPEGWWKFTLLPTNSNLWSLHYEMVYYLLFLAFWKFRPSLGVVLVIITPLAMAMYWLPITIQIVSAYACGLFFWAGGLWIAWRWPLVKDEKSVLQNWPSAVLLAVATWQMQFLGAVLHRAGRETLWGPWVMGSYLDFLPVALWIVANVSRRGSAFLPMLRLLAALWPITNFGWRIARGTMVWSGRELFLFVLTVAAIAVWRWRPGLAFFRRCAWLGLIAYAVYAIGAPVQHLVLHAAPRFAGSIMTYSTRLAVCVAIVLAMAWLLERRMQPVLRNWFLNSSAKT